MFIVGIGCCLGGFVCIFFSFLSVCDIFGSLNASKIVISLAYQPEAATKGQ
jgi:hypothetical protein